MKDKESEEARSERPGLHVSVSVVPPGGQTIVRAARRTKAAADKARSALVSAASLAARRSICLFGNMLCVTKCFVEAVRAERERRGRGLEGEATAQGGAAAGAPRVEPSAETAAASNGLDGEGPKAPDDSKTPSEGS
jgi:hypothetical protein